MSDDPSTPSERSTFRMRRAAIAAANVAQLQPALQMRLLGKLAADLTEVEAARLHRRLTRGQGLNPMNAGQLVAYAGKRARARVTHPGKRGYR